MSKIAPIEVFKNRVKEEVEALSKNGIESKAILARAKSDNVWELKVSQDAHQHYLYLHTLLTADPISVMNLLGDTRFTAKEIIDIQQNYVTVDDWQ